MPCKRYMFKLQRLLIAWNFTPCYKMRIMSSRSSLLLTNKSEHWYEETNEPRYKEGKLIGFDIDIEIDNDTIVTHELCEDEGLFITIKGDSQLAKILSKYLTGVDEKSVL